MIFARRAIQNRLNELRSAMGDDVVNKLVRRLNKPGTDRLSAMWETVIYHAFSQHGKIEAERKLSTGRCPDVYFKAQGIEVLADIATVSDANLEEQNPISELLDLIERAKTKLGYDSGGFTIKAGYRSKKFAKGSQFVLALPKKARLSEFVAVKIVPRIRQARNNGETNFEIIINDDEVDLKICFDPSKCPYIHSSGIGFHPQSKTRNPLYRTLKDKNGQLKGFDGLKGIIVTDGNSKSLEISRTGNASAQPKSIIAEFFRQTTSVDWILLLNIQTGRSPRGLNLWEEHEIAPHLFLRNDDQFPEKLKKVLLDLTQHMPKPIYSAINGSIFAMSGNSDFAFMGRHGLSADHIKISSREIVEVVSGRLTIQQLNERHDWSSLGQKHPDKMLNPFELWLQEGRLPDAFTLEQTGEDSSDDWVTIHFGDSDAAITGFK